MVFSSHLFCFYFLPATLALYFALPSRFRNGFLLVASYVFYGWSNPAFVFLMAFSTAVDYVCGRLIAPGAALEPEAPRTLRQRLGLLASVVVNLSLLGYFKYHDFGIDSWNAALQAAGWDGLRIEGALRVTLPLGISFYTFQSMSYTIDVYRGRTASLRSVVDFATYVAMFPQLVAGPIVRFSEVAAELGERTVRLGTAAQGVAFFALGMAKKVLLANPCGKLADLAFEAGSIGVLDAWLGVSAYAFQIYFDFSGYSEMAIGLGLLLGFHFPQNFDAPYRARSITDFWRRWHQSLSRWLRDYLYLPLGGNRRGPRRTLVNLFMVMLLGGLWHGAAWTFVAWGAYHGLLLVGERLAGRDRAWAWLPGPLRVAWVHALVLVSWVLFRAPSLGEAGDYLAAMLGLAPPAPTAALTGALLHRPYYLATWAVAAVVVWAAPTTWAFTRRIGPLKAAGCLVVFFLALLAMETQGYNPFIYFIF